MRDETRRVKTNPNKMTRLVPQPLTAQNHNKRVDDMSETTSKPKAKKSPKQPAQRPVIHDEVVMQCFVGEYAMPHTKAMELMGWITDEQEAKKKGLGDPLLQDLYKQDVWCEHNLHNRPLYMDGVKQLIQEILNKRWKFNGEPIIIGKTGIVLNGQHQLTALVLAEQHRLLDKDGQLWKELWPEPVVIEKAVIYGVDESDEVANTMDTCKPRSLTDVIFRSGLFKNVKGKDLKVMSRMLDGCVRLLWHRTGAVVDAFAPRRTHAEGMDFINRHPRCVKAVKHIWEEYQGGKDDAEKNWIVNNRRLGGGYAAAMLFLMGCDETDITRYTASKPPSEKKLIWPNWDKALDFWTKFCTEHEDLADLHRSLNYLVDPDTQSGSTMLERLSLITKAWNLYKEGSKITVKNISLDPDYSKENDAGVKRLVRVPTVGGIDLGDVKGGRSKEVVEADDVEGSGPAEPTVEEVKEEARKGRPRPKPKPKTPVESNGESEE